MKIMILPWAILALYPWATLVSDSGWAWLSWIVIWFGGAVIGAYLSNRTPPHERDPGLGLQYRRQPDGTYTEVTRNARRQEAGRK